MLTCVSVHILIQKGTATSELTVVAAEMQIYLLCLKSLKRLYKVSYSYLQFAVFLLEIIQTELINLNENKPIQHGQQREQSQ